MGFADQMERLGEELLEAKQVRGEFVNRVKEETDATLKRFTDHRQEMADELRETFQGYREVRKAFREELTKGGKAFRTAVTRRHPKEVAEVEEVPEKEVEVEEAEEAPYYEQVLEAIQSHLEGIRLADIGDQIGVAWQGLIPTVNRLLDQGVVRKEDQDYFPVE